MGGFHDNIKNCMGCDQREDNCTGLCRCTRTSLDISQHAKSGNCPLSLFGRPLPAERKRKRHGPDSPRYKSLIEYAIDLLPKFPEGRFVGRGVVIAAGGIYFDSAYVTIRVLRELKYAGPIELWHFDGEIAQWMRDSLADLGDVRLVNANQMMRKYPAVIRTSGKFAGYQLKVYALLNSSFKEAICIDADAYPSRPDFLDLFESDGFKRHGAIFFPDSADQDLKPHQWQAVGLTHRNEPAFESGIIYVDKSRCWRELSLALWMCEHGPDHFFKVLLGDKDTFHLSWRLLGTDYAMTSHRWTWPDGTRPPQSPALQAAMVQHDFDGAPRFVHRTVSKFSLTNSKEFEHFATTRQVIHKRDDRLPMEDFAWNALEDLREIRSKYLILHRLESNGDLLTLLPALKYLSRERQVTIITHRTYAPLVNGIPWLNVVPYDGSPKDVTGAILISKHLGELRDLEPANVADQPNWSLVCWARTGVPVELFHSLPLEIENRDLDAELALVEKYVEGNRPLMLLNTLGKSSPYPHGDRLRGFLRAYSDQIQVLDLAFVQSDRIIDLMGLYERACCLISTDTGTLHLGYATLTPTIALINDPTAPGPMPGWRASEKRAHWVETLTYSESVTDAGLIRIGEAIDRLIFIPKQAETFLMLQS